MDYRRLWADDTNRPTQFSFLCAGEEPLEFVVHEHWATNKHFDLRFQLGKILLDWVLRDVPSRNPKVLVEALPMKDHDPRCLESEGRIPLGSYGAGPMIMWDRGVYDPVAAPGVSREVAINEGIQNGHLVLNFRGQKMKGYWVLYKRGDKWFLKKIEDEYACVEGLPPRSVRTGRLITEL